MRDRRVHRLFIAMATRGGAVRSTGRALHQRAHARNSRALWDSHPGSEESDVPPIRWDKSLQHLLHRILSMRSPSRRVVLHGQTGIEHLPVQRGVRVRASAGRWQSAAGDWSSVVARHPGQHHAHPAGVRHPGKDETRSREGAQTMEARMHPRARHRAEHDERTRSDAHLPLPRDDLPGTAFHGKPAASQASSPPSIPTASSIPCARSFSTAVRERWPERHMT